MHVRTYIRIPSATSFVPSVLPQHVPCLRCDKKYCCQCHWDVSAWSRVSSTACGQTFHRRQTPSVRAELKILRLNSFGHLRCVERGAPPSSPFLGFATVVCEEILTHRWGGPTPPPTRGVSLEHAHDGSYLSPGGFPRFSLLLPSGFSHGPPWWVGFLSPWSRLFLGWLIGVWPPFWVAILLSAMVPPPPPVVCGFRSVIEDGIERIGTSICTGWHGMDSQYIGPRSVRLPPQSSLVMQ